MASTTPVTIRRALVLRFCRNSDEDSAPSEQTDLTDNLCIIGLASSVGNDIFAPRFKSVVPVNS